jgi:von Willebrand factor type A domain
MSESTSQLSATPTPPDEKAHTVREPRRRVWPSYALLALGVVTSLGAFAASRRPPSAPGPSAATPMIVATPPDLDPQANPSRPRVEIVFALDTTSSMSDLIEGAKRKIWSIASFVAQGQPTPDLRVGLVAYRDIGDEYVTRVHDLDDDLDRVAARLRRFRAQGGGDGPEHVARALDEAVRKMSWSDGRDVMKIIYLVGDAPPHTDYQDGYDFGRAARTAVEKGIAIHTIRCGDDADTEVVWRKIARIGKGQFMTVRQDGGMHDVATPYDDELARLHDQLSDTAMAYGADKARAEEARAVAAAAPMAVKVERAGFLASKRKAVGGAGDLLDDVASGRVKLESVPPAAMPVGLSGLAGPARSAAVAKKLRERSEVTARIELLTKQRNEHLARTRKPGAPADAFDEAAKTSLRESAAANRALGLKL